MIERAEEWLRGKLQERHEERLLRRYGGIQGCPWCRQWFQDYDGTELNIYGSGKTLDIYTCGNCRGKSVWLWGMGFHLMKLDEPPQPRHRGLLAEKEQPSSEA